MANVKRWLAMLIAVAAAMSACTIKKIVADNMPGNMDDIKDAFFAEESIRHAREAAPALLMMLDGFVRSSPNNEDLLVRAAEMNCSFALGLIEREDPAWATRLYLKGRNYAIHILSRRNAKFAKSVTNFNELKALLPEFKKEDVPPLFWAGICWGSQININRDDASAFSRLKYARILMERVRELDPLYFHGGADLFLGMYYGSRSALLGGNPQLAREHFGRVFAITQNRFLLAHVLYAENYAVQAQDRVLYEKTLQQVLEAPVDIDPREMLITAVSKKIAEQLLAKADELFVTEEEPPAPTTEPPDAPNPAPDSDDSASAPSSAVDPAMPQEPPTSTTPADPAKPDADAPAAPIPAETPQS